MSATQLAAYRNSQNVTSSGRELEAHALTHAALKLTECKNSWDSSDRDAKLDEALRLNQRIWSIFQGDLMKADNPLPRQLRQDILSLSAFIDKRIVDVMINPSPEKLTIIININLNLAAGLRANMS
jgi:flagellar biosynthesis activator protein FlaF